MILAAGEGTRLRPLTYARPKPLVPILTTPIIFHLLEWLKMHGIWEIAINNWYQPHLIEAFVRDGSAFGCSVRYLRERVPMGTAGAVRAMAPFLTEPQEPILVVGGDELVDVDIAEMVQFHKSRGAAVTISLAQASSPSQYGVVITDETGRIKEFIEKPIQWSQPTAWVNSGVYLLEPFVLDLIPADQFYDFGSQLFPRMVAEGYPVYGFYWDGFWADIGHIETYWDANWAALRQKITLYHSPLRATPDHIHLHPTADIADGAVLIPPCALGAQVVVERGATVGPDTIIGDRSVVKSSAVIERSILWNDVTVDDGMVLCDVIVTDGCYLSGREPIRKALIVSKR